jgi:hypothetical protein
VVIGGVGSWQRTDTDRTAGAYPKLNKLPLEGGAEEGAESRKGRRGRVIAASVQLTARQESI